MIRSSRKLLCGAASETVANTVRLGISLFNPYRFRGVLAALPHTVLPQSEVSQYMEAANRCFQDGSNVRLMPISSVVEIMHILSREFPSSPVLTSVRDSLIRTMNTPQRVIELAHAVESMRDFSDSILISEGIAAKLQLVSPRSPSRIRLSRYAQDPRGYLSHFFSSASTGSLSRLSPDQLVTLLQVLHSSKTSDSGAVLMECLKNKWNSDLVASSTLVSKVEFAGNILTVCERASPDVVALAGEIVGSVPDIVDLLSPDQIILVLHMLTGQASQLSLKALEIFRWRLSRDSGYLASIDGHHMTRLLSLIPALESRDRTSVMAQLQAPLMRLRRVNESDLVDICEAFSDLPGSPWVEHTDFANALFHHMINRVGMSDETVCRLVRACVDGIGVTDLKVACNLVDRFAFLDPENRSQLLDSLERSNMALPEQSRVGNLVLSKLLSEEGSDFTRIVENLKTKGSIPLHSQIYNLTIPQLIEIIDLIPSDRLADLEMVSEAANHSESIETRVDLLSKLTVRGFPCRPLVDSIVGVFSSLSTQDKIEVISSCQRSRVIPSQEIDVEALLNELGTCRIPATKIADFIHSLSVLGKIDGSSTCCRLIDAFISAVPRGVDHACAAGDVLASMLVSLTVPNDKQLDRLVRMILSDPTAVSTTSRLVIHEMNEVLENPALSDLVPHLPLPETTTNNDDLWTGKLVCSESFQRHVIVGMTDLSRVDLMSGHRAVVLARPEDMMENGELGQFFKFRLFIIGKKCRDVTVQNWMTLVN